MTPQDVTPPRTITVSEYYQAKHAFTHVPIFHITDRVTGIVPHGLTAGNNLYVLSYASLRPSGIVDGDTSLYVTHPWSTDDSPHSPNVNRYIDIAGRVTYLCNAHATRLLAMQAVLFAGEGDDTLSCAECAAIRASAYRVYTVDLVERTAVITLTPTKLGNTRKHVLAARIGAEPIDRNNLPNGRLGTQLARQEGSTIEREIDFGVCDYFRYRADCWQVVNLREQSEGHWTLSEWRLIEYDPHNVSYIAHQQSNTPCPCGYR